MLQDTSGTLLDRLKELEEENESLKNRLKDQKQEGRAHAEEQRLTKIDHHFSQEEYIRYGRQMIVPEFGSLKAQIKIKEAKVLVIGAGGLGCAALPYLAGTGVGEIGIVDDDTVDTSNLHRQILHNTCTVGLPKCESAKKYINSLNPHVKVNTYPIRLDNQNAFEIVEPYEIVLDCTDTPATRYLINDVSVICKKTIVNGSGLKTEGQFTVLNFRQKGPCYRCFYPQPPSQGSISTCADAGVLGPSIGLIGVAMALETIKIITNYYRESNFTPFLSQYSGYPNQQIRTFKMRAKKSSCVVCGTNPTITRESITSEKTNYSLFCGGLPSRNLLESNLRISVKDYAKKVNSPKNESPVLIDIRPKEQYEITKLPNSINIDWEQTFRKTDSIDSYLPSHCKKDSECFVVCRYGNDSQLAVKKMIDELGFQNVKDIKGGITKWSEEIDPRIPRY